MRHGPSVPPALTYQQRKAKHICTTPLCTKKAARRRAKCKEHLEARREYHNARNRANGMRTKAEYLANAKEEQRAKIGLAAYVGRRNGARAAAAVARIGTPAPVTAESPWAELTRVKAQLGRAVEIIGPLSTMDCFASGGKGSPGCPCLSCIADAFLAVPAPSQPEPVKAHAFECKWVRRHGEHTMARHCDGQCRCVCGNPDGPPWHAAGVG